MTVQTLLTSSFKPTAYCPMDDVYGGAFDSRRYF